MNLLAILNDNMSEPTDYTDRPTVKAVIVNEHDEVLLFSGGLPGGGVEVGETHEQALARELQEEIGAIVTITKELGVVVAYRDILKRKYIFTGYHCSLVSLETPTTTIPNEMGAPLLWKKRSEIIAEMEAHILEVKTQGPTAFVGDRYQRHLFNTEAALIFLKQIV